MTPANFGSLEALLDQLVVTASRDVESEQERYYQSVAFDRALRLLRVADDDRERVLFETRLRLALHLAPRDAIAYSHDNPVPRWQLVRDHLVSRYGRPAELAAPAARGIAVVLDNWDRGRDPVSSRRALLIRRHGPVCRHCHVRFDVEPVTLAHLDAYKPYFRSPEELLSPEVDHVEAISAIGTNELRNLQLLCRLCNAGKGDGLGMEVRHEAAFAGYSVERIPTAHLARLVYYVIDRDNRHCTQCDRDDLELTIRPIVDTGGVVRSNLRTVCVACGGSSPA